MKRAVLFIMTNLAVLAVLTISLQVLGVEQMLASQGTGFNLTGLIVFAALLGMGGSFISLAISKTMAIRSTGARVIDQPADRTEAWLLETVERHARSAGVGMPDVAIYDSPEANAFATGMKRDHALVAVSTGLLRNMSRGEAEAVLGHEVSHVANGDMVTLALIQGVVNTFVIVFSRVVGYLVDRLVFRTERGYGPGFWIATIVAQLMLGVLASMIVMWFSRWREFRADAGGAHLAGRGNMIAALQRLGASAESSHLPEELAAFGIRAGFGRRFGRLLMSHPPIEERIAALRAMT